MPNAGLKPVTSCLQVKSLSALPPELTRQTVLPITTTITTLRANLAGYKLTSFSYFSQKTGLDISCRLSPLETTCMMCANLFCWKIRKKYFRMLSAEIFTSVLSVSCSISGLQRSVERNFLQLKKFNNYHWTLDSSCLWNYLPYWTHRAHFPCTTHSFGVLSRDLLHHDS